MDWFNGIVSFFQGGGTQAPALEPSGNEALDRMLAETQEWNRAYDPDARMNDTLKAIQEGNYVLVDQNAPLENQSQTPTADNPGRFNFWRDIGSIFGTATDAVVSGEVAGAVPSGTGANNATQSPWLDKWGATLAIGGLGAVFVLTGAAAIAKG